MSIMDVPLALRDRALVLATVGSTAHGVSVSQIGPEGDDLDLMGTYVPDPEEVYGLKDAKTIVWRSKPEGVRSEAGDVDLTLHPLRKFLKLAYNGNPTILAVLFSGDQHVLRQASGNPTMMLLNAAPRLCSKRSGYAFRGYAEQQYQRLMGERGQMKVKRPELVTAHGYDVKYAAHVLRLCEQGIVMLRDGFMPMPLDGAPRDFILSVRRGEVPFDDCMERITERRARLDLAIDETKLPEFPPEEFANELAIDLHEMAWHH